MRDSAATWQLATSIDESDRDRSPSRGLQGKGRGYGFDLQDPATVFRTRQTGAHRSPGPRRSPNGTLSFEVLAGAQRTAKALAGRGFTRIFLISDDCKSAVTQRLYERIRRE